MAWLLLTVAGLLEIVWAVALKQSEGFSRLLPSLGFVVASAASVVLLALALRSLPVSTAYPAWTGIGTVGTACVGFLVLNEPSDIGRIACVTLIVIGIAGLGLSTGG